MQTSKCSVTMLVTCRRHMSHSVFQKHCANILAKSVSAPPRRAGEAPLKFLQGRSRSAPGHVPNNTPKYQAVREEASEDFNAALYGAKAFGIATLFVSVGAVTTIWGLKTILGVRDVRILGNTLSNGLFMIPMIRLKSSEIACVNSFARTCPFYRHRYIVH